MGNKNVPGQINCLNLVILMVTLTCLFGCGWGNQRVSGEQLYNQRNQLRVSYLAIDMILWYPTTYYFDEWL